MRYTTYTEIQEAEIQGAKQTSCTDVDDRPGNVTARNVTWTSIEFIWLPPPCLQEAKTKPINYTYKLTNLGTNAVIASGRTPDTRVTLLDLEPSTFYIFLVAASPLQDVNRFAEPLMTSTLATEPATPSGSHIASKDMDSLFMMWDSPDDSQDTYMVQYEIIEMPYNLNFTSDVMSDTMRQRRQTSIIDSIEGNSYMLTDLLPSTKYQIGVSSTNQDGVTSDPDIVYAYTIPADYTYMGVPESPIPENNTIAGATSVDVILPQTQSQFHTGYQIAVQRSDTPLPLTPGKLQFDSFYTSPTAYAAAEFSKVTPVPNTFTVGDNHMYSKFYNAPLQKSYTYFIYFGIVSRINDTDAGYSWSSAATVTILDPTERDYQRLLELALLANISACQEIMPPVPHCPSSPANKSFLHDIMREQAADARDLFIITLCIACMLFLVLTCILAVCIVKSSLKKSEEPDDNLEMRPPTERRGTIGRSSGQYTVTLPRPIPHLGSDTLRRDAWVD